MKHNFVKRTLAGLTAVLCVAGNAAATADTVLGGLLGGTAIVASAETKPLAVGTVYYIGDVVNFTQDAYVNRGSYTNKIASGEWKVNDSFCYIESDSAWRFEIQNGSSGRDIFCANTEPNKGKPRGVKCIEGDGTEANPYKFETYYETSVAGVTSGETTTNYADFAEALEAWTDGSTLTLHDDAEISSTIGVSGTKTLDLNGHGIKNTAGTSVISVASGADFTLNDSAPTLTDTGAARPEGVIGGYLTGYDREANDGCVTVGGTFTMNGGSIAGNNGRNGNGAGVSISNGGGKFIMNGGCITGNSAGIGAGVYCWGGGVFTMNGGKIANNSAITNGFGGGAVLIHGTMNMTGGIIVDNTAASMGGGILIWDAGTLNVSGDAIIKDNKNTSGKLDNVYLRTVGGSSKKITVIGELGENAEIGVSMQNFGEFTNSAETDNNAADKFTSDLADYVVVKDETDGQLKLIIDPEAIAHGEYTDIDAFNAAEEENPVLKLFADIGTLTITRPDGTVDLNGHTVSTIYYQNNDPDKTVTIKNGTVTKEIDGAGGLSNDFKGKVVFEDLNVPSNNVWLDGHTLTIKSGKYNTIQNSTNLNGSPLSVVTIEGGTFNTLNLGSKGEKYIISGGVFAKEPNEDWIAEGAVCTQRENDWLVSTYTAPKITFEKGDGCVKLTWDAVEGAEKYGVYGYMNGKWQELASGKGNSYVLKGLTAGKDYKVCVAARLNGKWYNDPSNAIVVTPKLNTVKENPAVSYEKGKNAVKLTWDKVEGAQKYAVCGYAGGKWTILAEGFGNSYVMKDLKTGAEYKVAVAAMINGKWNTDFSNAIIVSPKEKRVPEYPTVKAQAYKDRFRVQWTAVEGAQKYGLAVYQKGKWVPKVQFDADTTEYISPSLKKGDYKCVIAAKVDGEWELGEADSRAFTVSIF